MNMLYGAEKDKFLKLLQEYEAEFVVVVGWRLDTSLIAHTEWPKERMIATLLSWLFSRDTWIPAVPLPPEMRDPVEWLFKEVRQWIKAEKEKG